MDAITLIVLQHMCAFGAIGHQQAFPLAPATAGWDDFSGVEKATARLAVRDLLTALRTPSEEMVEAMRPDGNAGYFGDAFTAAIDVLLTPKDPNQ